MTPRTMYLPGPGSRFRLRPAGGPLLLLLLVASIAAALPSPAAGRPRAADVRRWLQPPPATQPAAPVQTFTATDRPLKSAGAAGAMRGKLAEWLKPFDRKPETFCYTIQRVEDEEALRSCRLVFPSPFKSQWPENNVVTCELYLPRPVDGAGGAHPASKAPAAIVLDIMDGSAIIPRGMARGLAEQGVVALYMPMSCYGPRRPKDPNFMKRMQEDPQLAIDNVRQTVMDIRRAKAILAGRPEVDEHHLAITGVSLGGIMAALAAGVDGEFDRVVPILAGGDLADIIFHARETRRLREAIQDKGISREQAAAFLAPIDPLSFAARISPRSCLMINAAYDEVIPKATTDALNKAIGAPQILWTPAGHYSSILFLPNIRQRVIEFILGKKVQALLTEQKRQEKK